MEEYVKALRHIITLMGNTDGWSVVGHNILRYRRDDKYFTVRFDETHVLSTMYCYGNGFGLYLPPSMMVYFQPLKDALSSGKQGEVVFNPKILGWFSDEVNTFLADFS